MPSERSSFDNSNNNNNNNNNRNNYEEQCYQQMDNPISNCNNNGINGLSSTKTHQGDPMSQIILQDRRHRNLLASKKYRAKKQKLDREKNEMIQSLSDENQSLKRKVQELEFENKSLKEIMSRLTTSSAASILDRERLCRKGDNQCNQ
ncbi:hypothetical protein RhiirC2_740132 [Rhizophagus irregularis]|uniref:BZIP domain-containing protein n=1 Tax=Rhizophagus irregularis TaxID=588596 RepID=A0A2N1NIN9_9GLOM|nr:hypothetical protein RhiirC2_740132 [Rhizophagus irregularis]